MSFVLKIALGVALGIIFAGLFTAAIYVGVTKQASLLAHAHHYRRHLLVAGIAIACISVMPAVINEIKRMQRAQVMAQHAQVRTAQEAAREQALLQCQSEDTYRDFLIFSQGYHWKPKLKDKRGFPMHWPERRGEPLSPCATYEQPAPFDTRLRFQWQGPDKGEFVVDRPTGGGGFFFDN